MAERNEHEFDDEYYIVGYKDGYIAIGCDGSYVTELYVLCPDGEGNPVYLWHGLRLEFCGSEPRSQWDDR
jgi:hypothetical protein